MSLWKGQALTIERRVKGTGEGPSSGPVSFSARGGVSVTLQFPAVGHWLFSHIETGSRELKLCWEEEASLLKFSASYVMGLVSLSFSWLEFENCCLVD